MPVDAVVVRRAYGRPMAKRRTPTEFLQLFEAARRNAAGTPPRKHHLVPASYLRRWADGGKVRVTVVDEQRSYLTAPERAARETDYYSLSHEAVDPEDLPPLLMETMLGKLEDTAATVTGILETRQPDALTATQRAEMAVHLAFQITRGHAFRAEQQHILNDYYRLQYEGYTDRDIRRHLEQVGASVDAESLEQSRKFLDDLVSGEIEVGQSRAQEVALAASAGEKLAEHLWGRTWVVFDTKPVLVTCDEPVVLVGGPGSPRGERAGVATAGVVLHALTPSRLLAMFHPGLRADRPRELDPLETVDVNREILGATARWAFERPSRELTLRLLVPPPPPEPFVREGPLPQAPGANGDIYRNFKPTRWSQRHPEPDWPVARWWR